jgi:hypothetical protein
MKSQEATPHQPQMKSATFIPMHESQRLSVAETGKTKCVELKEYVRHPLKMPHMFVIGDQGDVSSVKIAIQKKSPP